MSRMAVPVALALLVGQRSSLRIAVGATTGRADHAGRPQRRVRPAPTTGHAMKILVAGFQHETNTFAPTGAGYASFVNGEDFPAMARGEQIHALADVNIPVSGFLQAVQACAHTVMQ